jgi:hypothetical protein
MILTVGLISAHAIVSAQKQSDRSGLSKVVSAKERPDLAIDLQSTAKLKLVMRKELFHIGEMINLDMALLNQSKEPVYLYAITHPKLTVKDELGNESIVQSYIVVDLAIGLSAYKLVGPDDFTDESFELLAGCDMRAFEQVNSTVNDDSSLTIFNKNRFLNWGNACLQIKRPGTYYISAEFSNDRVVASGVERQHKTAVGKIKSNLLKIVVVE